jgi:hypothetical protein
MLTTIAAAAHASYVDRATRPFFSLSPIGARSDAVLRTAMGERVGVRGRPHTPKQYLNTSRIHGLGSLALSSATAPLPNGEREFKPVTKMVCSIRLRAARR